MKKFLKSLPTIIIVVVVLGLLAYWIRHRQLLFVAPRVVAPQDMPETRVIRVPTQIDDDIDDALPIEDVPQAPEPRQPVQPVQPRGISGSDRLPWENNRVRSDVIHSLERDIARVEGLRGNPQSVAYFQREFGGIEVYLSSQRARLQRARNEAV